MRGSRILLLTFMLAVRLPAQDVQPPPKEPRHPRGEMKRDLTPGEHERRRREWRAILHSLTREERRAFLRMPRSEKWKFIRRKRQELRRRERERREEAFLKSLPKQERERLLALDPRQRHHAILAMKVDRSLRKVLEAARARGLVGEDEERRILSEKNARKRAETVLELQKEVFVDAYRAALEDLPVAMRREVLALSPRRFFEHPAIRRLPVVRFFDQRRVRRIVRQQPALREALKEAQRTGEIPPELDPLFRVGRKEEFLSLEPDERRRSLGHLLRAVDGGRRRSDASRNGGLRPRNHQQRPRSQRTGPPTLRELKRRFDRLPAAERERLLDVPLPRLLERLFPGRSKERRSP